MFYVKQRQKVNVYRGFGGFCGAVRQSIRRIFVDLAVLLAEGYMLSVEIWVVAYVCPKWCEAFAARVLRCILRRGFTDEGVERDASARVSSCCMTSSPLSIIRKDHSGLLGESLWGDCNGRCCADRDCVIWRKARSRTGASRDEKQL